MATALAQQLAQLHAARGPQERFVRGKHSLLFDYQTAADVSAETLLGIAQQGLGTLCKADKRFSPFTESLFSRASLTITREQLTKGESNQLNSNLRAFLHVVTNHFLAPAAFQVLEYCIRRYKVHVYNVGDLLLCALPYHSTPEFARLVALLQLQKTAWEWLAPCQQSGAPPPRELLVRRCVNDQAVLREVCQGAQALGMTGFVSRTYLSFYAVLLCEVLMASPAVTEELLTTLLPFLVAGLKESAAKDYRAATLMVLTQLLSRAQLSKDFLSVVVVEVIRCAADLGGPTSLMLLAHMAASQPHLHSLPARALQLMLDHCEAGQQLADLQARGANLQPLIKLLLPSLAQALPQHPQLQPLLLDLLHNVTLEPSQVQAAALQLLKAGALQLQQQQQAGSDEAAAGKHLQQALRVFDLRYPDQLDAAINAALREAAAAGGSAAAAAADGKKQHKKSKQQVSDANIMFEFVQQCFSGSRHEVVPATGPAAAAAASGQQQALTLSLAVSAPASEMRIMALQKLDAICSTADAPESSQQLLQSSLVTCLRDDVLAVAATAATAAGLAAVPAEQQLPALQYLLSRAADKLAAGHAAAAATDGETAGSEGSKQILKAAKAALAAVAAVGERAAAAADVGDSEQQQQTLAVQRQAAALLLEHVLADKRTKKLAKAAVAACCSCSWQPLLQALAAAPGVAAALQQQDAAAADAEAPATSDSKRRKKGSKADAAAAAEGSAAAAVHGKHAGAVALNRAAVQALADALTAAGGGVALLSEVTAVAAKCRPRCCHLLLLALVKAAAAAAAASGPAGAAGSVPQPTPSGKGRAKGRQQRQSSSQVLVDDQGAASAAHIVIALLALLEQQLAQASSSDGSKKQSKSSSGGFSVPEDWASTADSVLDASFLPTKQHLQQLHSQLQQLQAALLLSGLKVGMAAAAPDSLAEHLGQPVQLFTRLAAAASTAAAGDAAAGSGGLLEHLQLLVAKSGQQPQQQLSFLAGIYGLPAGSCSEAAQVAALQLLHSQSSSSSELAVSGVAPGSSNSWFVQLLAAVDSKSKRVRAAAVDALLALPQAVAASSSSSSAWTLEGGFTAEQLSELVAALQPHEALLKSSAAALTPLMCNAAAAAAGVTQMEVDSAARAGRGSSRRGKAAGAKAASAAAEQAGDGSTELQLPAGCCEALQQLLLAVLPQLHAEPQLLAAEFAVTVLAAAAGGDAAAAAQAAAQLLQQLLLGLCTNIKPPAAASGASVQQVPAWQQLAVMPGGQAGLTEAAGRLQQLRSAVAVALLQFYTPEAVQAAGADVSSSYISLLQLPFADAAAAAAGLAEAAVSSSSSSSDKLSDPQLSAVAPVRAAALQQLDAAMFEVVDPEQQQAVFTAALQAHASDGDAACRAAARDALAELPVTAAMLLQLLQRVGAGSSKLSQQQQSKAKRSKRSSQTGSQHDAMDVDAAPAAGPITAADLDAAIAALELLQWKDDVQDKQQLVQPLQHLLQLLTPLMGSIAESHQESEATATEDEQAAAGDRPAASASAAGYAVQLTLLALEQLAKEQEGAAIDPSLVLGCASAAPDGAVRNAALLLLAVLAQRSPEDVLGHVLQALSVIQHSAAFQQDSHSQAVASAALAALVPAWLDAGRGSEELWGSLLVALPGLPAPRRLKLLESLQNALPEEAGLPVGLLLMMQRVVAGHKPAAATATLPAGKTPKKGKKQPEASAAEPDAAAAAAAAPEEAEWLPDLMAALCEKVAVLSRLAAFSSVLQSSLSGSGGQGPVPAHAPLPRLAVTFITANLKAKSVLSAAHSAADRSTLQATCHSIMSQALLHLQQLNPTAAAASAASTGTPKTTRKLQKAMRAAATGVYDLLAALEAVQDCPSYLTALVGMSRHPADAVQRRALKLLAARLLKAQIDLADLETAAAAAGLSAAEKAAKAQSLAESGLAVCQELPRLLGSEAALTRQLALIAADAGIRQFGGLLPVSVLGCLSVVVNAARDDAAAPVRVSALACIAAGVAAVGPKLVPLLPQTASVVLAAAQAACKDLEGFDHQQHKQQQADAPAEQQDSDDEGDESGSLSKGEEAALQLAGALAALEALVTNLGAFMSPYLKPLLQLLVHRQVLSCSTAGGADAAARLRAALPVKVPPRLLLEPLVSQWDYALAACSSGSSSNASSEPAVAFLELVALLASSMEPSVAVTYHEQLVTLLLRALDTRQKWLAAASGQQQRAAGPVESADVAAAAAALAQFGHGGVHAVEAAAVKALAALVMKLSESKFKPMFLRLVDWANAGAAAAAAGADAAAGAASQGQGRAAAFMAAVCTLAHRLRGVFAPYYRYFSVMLMKQLVEGTLQGEKRPKKKHKKAAAAAAAADGSDAAGGDLSLAVSSWLARLSAVRAVHLLALHEPAGATPAAQQEQQERFDRLLPLVVEQLAEGPPAAVAAVLAVEGADSALDLPGGPAAALGAAGKAAVEAGGAAVVQDSCDVVGTAAVGALLQMAIAGGSDVVWKPLHHALLMATRGGGVRAKLLAIGGVSRLAELLREEYLMLLPEALPFISELIEDGEVAVEGAAQGLVAQLEGLSGEKLEQYLKA